MKHFGWRWLAISSLLICVAVAEVRPRYGGTLHVAMRAAPASPDPADSAFADSSGGRSLISLIYDTLVTTDESGHALPGLAEAWQSSRGNQRWELRLRRGVKFSDGTSLTAEIAAASLRTSNPAWNVSAEGTTVIVQLESADAAMLAELALPRNSIAKRDSGPVGTGAFQITSWQPGKSASLNSNEDCWRGRPFLDQIEIEMGKSFRDQMTAFDLRKTDLVEVAPEQTHHFVQEGRRLTSSARIELLAIVFNKDVSTPEDKLLRQALSLSIERGSIRSVLLQGAGEPTASILPTSISGYGFVFPTGANLQKARQLRNEIRSASSWTMGYDVSDPLMRVLAERIALNAKDAGLSLRPVTSADADMRVMRIAIASADPWVALNEILARISSPSLKNKGGSVEELYASEQAALGSERVIPLFHLPVSYASTPGLTRWSVRVDGSWNLDGAWLETSKP